MSGEIEVGLAATKLRPPTLPDHLVPRSRLDAVLDRAVDRHNRLLLVSAPAGSGKSTLLASWLDGRPEANAWLQVEDGDDDPARFWAYLVEAIGQVLPGVRTVVKPVILASTGDYDMVVSALVSALDDFADPLVVVVDDYHLISNDEVHRGTERLVELCPPHVTIVLSTRFDPPFRLGRLRVRNHLVEIRGDGLRFELIEAASLLDAGEQSLSSDDVELLSGRTEGWAAGLVLARLSLRQSSNAAKFIQEFHGDDQMVVDYLSDEFLAGVNNEHRQRLLATSILEQLSGPLVDAVCGSTDGKQWVRETAAANQLVIGLDRTGEWFRYHHLFRDLLRVEANEVIPDQLSDLHRRAASWFESERDHHRAVSHWLSSGDRHGAARVMYFHGPRLIADNQIETLRRILDDLGGAGRADAACALLWGWSEFIAGRYSAAEQWVATTHDIAPDGFDLTITAPLRMNILLGRGDVDSALSIARELTDPDRLEALPPELAPVAVVAGGVLMWAGQRDDARSVLDVGVRKAEQVQAKSAQVLALIYHAIVEFDEGNRAAARDAAITAITTADELGIASYYRLGPAYAIRAHTAEGAAETLIDARRAVELVQQTTGNLPLAYVLTICGDIAADLGDSQGLELLAEARRVVESCPDPGIVGRYLDRIESRHAAAANPVTAPTLVEQLTERETAVLRFLPTTLSQREIAGELFVSANTVKTHCAAIYRKLAVSSRKAAVQAARDLGLL
jgi:LuxR family maltose regulon positive regulatory protein